MLNIIYFKKILVHILPKVNVFSHFQFRLLLLMLCLNMYNIIYKYKNDYLFLDCLVRSDGCCFLLVLFIVMVVHHCFTFCCNNEYTLTHTYMIMLCSIFTNHKRMLVHHLVVTSKINATLNTRLWLTFICIDVSNRKVRRIVLS